MFSFFHRTPKIYLDCFTSNTTAYKYAPLVYAGKSKPKWFDKVTPPKKSNADSTFYSINENGLIGFNRDYSLRTVRSCYGLLELYKRGFMLESWCDLAFNVDKDVFSFHYSNGEAPVMHKSNQVDPGFKDYHIVKLRSPWYINVKENAPFIAIGPEWSLEDYNFKVLPGVVNFYTQSSSNLFMTINKNIKQQIYIPVGQPVVHFIPLVDKKMILKNHMVTDDELKTKMYDERGTSIGWRRTVSLVKRNEERKSKCPFGFGE